MTGLDRLFRPRNIAVIGGGVWCRSVIEQCQKIGFEGDIWPVHPSKDEIAGRPAFDKIDALPSAPDAAFVGINRHATIDAIRALARFGAGGAICFASGFSEAASEDADGSNLEAHLIEASGGMPLIGPNCYGFINYLDNVALWPDQHGGQRLDKGVAILTQSSNMAINITMQKRSLPIAYMVTLGNQAVVTMADVGHALLADERVTALGCHIEGFGDLSAFENLAQSARELGKPIVALKVGKSEQAQSHTISHTASLAGSDAGAQAFLDRLGVGRAESLAEFIEALKLIHIMGPMPGTNIASMSCSGGEASLMADAGQMKNITFPPLSPEQFNRLRDVLGPKVALSNPLDYHTYIWHDRDALQATFAAMSSPEIDISFIVLDFPRLDRCNPDDWEFVLGAIENAAKETGRPYGVIATLAENMPEHIAARLMKTGIAPMCGIEDALAAVRIAATRQIGSHAPVIHTERPSETKLLSERDAKTLLASHGMNIPKNGSADSPEAAVKLAEEIGFPVVVKGEGLAHKSEHSAVHLNLISSDAVLRAAKNTPSDTYLVEQMVTDVITELLIGIVRDDAHGFLLVLAAGGIYTEILDDQQSLLLPCTRADLEKALSKLKISPVLNGYRGKPAVNQKALVDNILSLQEFVLAHAEKIEEIDINPLICRANDVIVADALIKAAL